MICKRCIHEDVCSIYQNLHGVWLTEDSDNEVCFKFKDKDFTIQLPCKFGERLYSIRTRYDSNRKSVGKPLMLSPRNLGYVVENYGKTVFTKEQVAGKLKEENKKC